MTPKPTVQKRPRGTGYVSPVATDAGWRFKARYPNGTADRTLGTFATEDEAHRALNAVDALRQNAVDASGALAFLTYFDRWLGQLPDKNLRSWHSVRNTVIAVAPFAGYALDEIQRADLKGWAKSLLKHVSPQTDRAISRQTAKHALGLVRRCLAAAVHDDELIKENPADGVKLPRRDEPESDGWTYLTQAEIDRLLGHPDMGAKPRSAFALAIYTGLRQGELAALEWQHVDLDPERPRIRVLGSWDGATKTTRTRRIALLPAARAALLAWWERCGRPVSGLVWVAEGGVKRAGARHSRGYDWGWADTRDYTKGVCWLGWRRRAGIDRRVRFHDLRHTCASHLITGTWGRKWSLREVQEMLGHTNETVTERYAHLADGALDKAARATVHNPSAEPSATASKSHQHQSVSARNHLLRAMGDSNARPSAPEADAERRDHSAFRHTDGWRTDLWEAAHKIAGGGAVAREHAEELAAGALAAASELIDAAGAVLDADDDALHMRLLDLAELAALAPPAPVRTKGEAS